MGHIIAICDLISILDTIFASGPHNTHLRFRYTCDDNRKRFAIIVAFAVYVPHCNVRYFICGLSRSNTITAICCICAYGLWYFRFNRAPNPTNKLCNHESK